MCWPKPSLLIAGAPPPDAAVEPGRRRAKREQSGAFLIEGGLYREGKDMCRAVHIECAKKPNQCDMIEVRY